MGVNNKELFHGAVLTKLISIDKPISLRLIELNVDQSRSAYLIDTDSYIYIKSSKNPKPSTRDPGVLTWHFTFNTKHLKELNDLRKEKDVCLALVCGQTMIGKDKQEDVELDNPIEIGFLDWDSINSCLDLTKQEQQYITVKYRKRHKLEV
jgi:hypothetical protein